MLILLEKAPSGRQTWHFGSCSTSCLGRTVTGLLYVVLFRKAALISGTGRAPGRFVSLDRAGAPRTGAWGLILLPLLGKEHGGGRALPSGVFLNSSLQVPPN